MDREKAATDLAIALRKRRRELGFTQVEFAHRLGRSQGYVSKYEQAKRKLTLDEVAELCTALEMDLVKFLTAWACGI